MSDNYVHFDKDIISDTCYVVESELFNEYVCNEIKTHRNIKYETKTMRNKVLFKRLDKLRKSRPFTHTYKTFQYYSNEDIKKLIGKELTNELSNGNNH